MANNSLSGKGGSVTGITGVSEITGWTINLVSDTIDVTSKASSGWREFILGLQTATGNLTAVGNAIPPLPTDGAQTLNVSFPTDSGSAVTIAGDVILSNIGTGSPVDGRVEFTADFQFTGEVTVS